LVLLLLLGNFGNNFGVDDLGKPVSDKRVSMIFEVFKRHPPEIRMKDSLHPSCSEYFVKW
jgi:hypothetical protein